jgi:uncharacterized protein YqgC (DUF456 family)
MTIVLWILAIALIAIGVVGTVVPAVPGVILVFAGMALGAWIDQFTRIPVWLLVILGVLTVMAWTLEYVAGVLGAKRAGASGRAIAGAAIGTIVGIFTGLWGLIFMPLVGAAIGEYSAQRDLRRAGKVGVATWIGLLLGTAAKVAIVFTMIAMFLTALLL